MLTILFVGLWCLADRDGRLEDRPKRIRAEIFPYRECHDINGYLTVLEQLGFIERYQAENHAVIQVVNFSKHQSPHKTEKPSELPAKPAMARVTCNAPLDNESLTVKESLIPDSLIPDSLIPDSLCDSAVPDKPGTPQAIQSNESAPKSKRSNPKQPIPENFTVTRDMILWVEENNYGHIDLSDETGRFIDHWKSKGEARADWVASWRTWIRNADKYQRASQGARGKRDEVSAAIQGY